MWLSGWGCLMSAMSCPASCSLITSVRGGGGLGKVTSPPSARNPSFLGANMSLSRGPNNKALVTGEVNPHIRDLPWVEMLWNLGGEGSGIQMI